MRNTPASPTPKSRIDASTALARSTKSTACAYNALPAADNTIRLPFLSNSEEESSRSNVWICCETVACAYPSDCAALKKLPLCTTSIKVCKLRRLIFMIFSASVLSHIAITDDSPMSYKLQAGLLFYRRFEIGGSPCLSQY